MPITNDEKETLIAILGKIDQLELVVIAKKIYHTLLSAGYQSAHLMVLGKLVFAKVHWDQIAEILKNDIKLPLIRATEEFFVPGLVEAFRIVEEEDSTERSQAIDELMKEDSFEKAPEPAESVEPSAPSQETQSSDTENTVEGESGENENPEEDRMLMEKAAAEAALEAKAEKALAKTEAMKEESEKPEEAVEAPEATEILESKNTEDAHAS